MNHRFKCFYVGVLAMTTQSVFGQTPSIPTFSYQLPQQPSALFRNEAAFSSILPRLESDYRALLTMSTTDPTRKKQALQMLRDLAAIAGRYPQALQFAGQISALTPDIVLAKVGSGMSGPELETALLAAMQPKPERESFFKQELSRRMQQLPWPAVESAVRQWKGNREINSANACEGILQSIDEKVARTGAATEDDIGLITRCRRDLLFGQPYKQLTLEVLRDYLAAHQQARPAIWEARQLAIPQNQPLSPVLVAIWDTGLDSAVYPQQMWKNPKELFNQLDDDQNGYIDDHNGIRFSLYGKQVLTGTLPELGSHRDGWQNGLRQMKGMADMQTGVDSPEAEQVRVFLSEMKPQLLGPFLEDASFYQTYSHGTYVAGIAAHAHPTVRLMSVSMDFPWQQNPEPMVVDSAQSMATFIHRSIAYMQAHGVRIANMSWGWTLKDIENDLENNGIGSSAEQRSALALESFNILKTAMYSAMKAAPTILFVEAAGNSGEDVGVLGDIPATLQLENVIVVGAADHAGYKTTYSARGALVDVYANGHEITSHAPGGSPLTWSGASAAAPQVSNLAAWLLAREPNLSTPELKQLILKGADKNVGDGETLLLNPKASLRLFEQRQTTHAPSKH